MRVRDIILALFAMALWGLNFALAKLALAEFPPILLAALRFTLVAVVLVPIRPRLVRPLSLLALAMTLGFIHFPMVFSGLRLLDASTSAVVLQLQVPFGVLLAALLIGERVRWQDWIGMVIAFAGVALIAGAPRLGSSHLGLAFLLVAAFGWGLSTVQLKKIGPIDPLTLNGWLGLFIAIELWAVSAVVDGSPLPFIAHSTWRGWIGMSYTALVSTIVAYGAWAYLVHRYPVGRTMPFMLLIPLFAILGGIALNGDRLTIDIVAGGALTIVGVGLIVIRWPRRRPLAAPAAGAA